eukprot:TRINITY_DN43756_c0_g1_i1.p1 TRINITY_DN43756_c0_g1~~TRINITY_DN43756_c0_g1_i1.p1  ORF type:complete len:539 (+),score=70.87 TRINITY_DN43756_c0_g1_i1:73-1689(+)
MPLTIRFLAGVLVTLYLFDAVHAFRESFPWLSATTSTSLAPEKTKVSEYLNMITIDGSGKPNPRVTCTEGNDFARRVVVRELESLGVKPLGKNGFTFTVPDTMIPDVCPEGITNVIGYIEGTDPRLKDEYIMWNAHLDGPNNEGPSKREGNLETDNSYDDAGAVAVGLLMAAEFSKSPPARSIIFFFSDGEEGMLNVGSKTQSEWDEMPANALPATGRRLCKKGVIECRNYPIGFKAWASNPTVDLEKIKLLVSADPLGSPGIHGSDFVALIGAEATPGLLDLVKSVWPSESAAATRPLFVNREYVKNNYNDADALTRDYRCSAGSKCLAGGGIPYLWLAQPGFHKYHGGASGYIASTISNAYWQATGGWVSLPVDEATWALDTRKNFDYAALVKVANTLIPTLRTLADAARLSELHYDPSVYQNIEVKREMMGYSLQDAKNNKEAYDFMYYALSKSGSVTHLPWVVALKLKGLCWYMSSKLEGIIAGWDSSTGPEALGKTFPPLLTGLALGLDFWNSGDESSQRFAGGPGVDPGGLR